MRQKLVVRGRSPRRQHSLARGVYRGLDKSTVDSFGLSTKTYLLNTRIIPQYGQGWRKRSRRKGRKICTRRTGQNTKTEGVGGRRSSPMGRWRQGEQSKIQELIHAFLKIADILFNLSLPRLARKKRRRRPQPPKLNESAYCQKEEEEQEAKKASAKATKPAVSKSAKKSGPSSTAVPEFSARNIALDLLDIANEKTDKASLGAKAAKGVDAHPERRFKAAFEAYKENELPGLRKEVSTSAFPFIICHSLKQPGLRLQQYHDLLYKQFQKHPDNPFNQVTVAYDATKEDKVAALQTKKKVIEERYVTLSL
ncbi:hypothetical protein VP01_2371g1 [Puccinia sorghi]|uniref:Coiled-coil domain-containing protein n=1 Tax=Puccinia sorghi TaxID=27349 RepID=A0A0L6V778_9BASI|nr:hypothetical protein VP01_2371g1 [Puccinia sorghi]